jgi:crotonobetainyl-CoA:carnitine CoA-transferase CaiB-like acyl-CoA transferase
VQDIVARLRAADVPCAEVRSPQQAIDSPQLRARGMVQALLAPDGRDTGICAAGLPIKLSRSTAAYERPAPAPGADTAALLRERLGLDEGELARLRADGIV